MKRTLNRAIIFIHKTSFPSITLALLFLIISFPAVCLSEVRIDKSTKERIHRQLSTSPLAIVPQLNKITTGFGNINSKEFYYVKSVDKIFFQDAGINANITGISYKKDGIIFKLSNDMLGEGRIRLVFPTEKRLDLSYEDVVAAIKDALSSHDNLSVVINKRTNTYHSHNSNHLPAKDDSIVTTLTNAHANGYKPCGYCFIHVAYIPDQKQEEKLARQGAAALRFNAPLIVDDSTQDYIKSVGKSVLEKWPIPLIGYDYKFQVIDDNEPNAVALPGGHIMVTSGLLSGVENREELEAALAHEIAHVEKRHSLREYQIEYEKMQAQGALAAFGAAAAGIAGASSNQNMTAASLAVTAVAMIAIETIDNGYAKEHEKEADELVLLYFQRNKMDKGNLENIFKKFSFLSLAKTYDPDPESATHPYFEERIAFSREAKVVKLNEHQFILNKRNYYPVHIDFAYQSYYGGETSIVLYIDDQDMLDKLDRNSDDVKLVVLDQREKKIFRMKRHGIVRDTWGGYITLRAKYNSLLKNIREVALQLEIPERAVTTVVDLGTSDQQSRTENYNFVINRNRPLGAKRDKGGDE